MRRACLALLVLGAWHANDACAQLSGSAGVVSDYRYRGFDFSEGDPALQINLLYDHPSGWYLGTFASTVKLAAPERRGALRISYAGYAWRLRSGPALELGVSDVAFPGAAGAYCEVYAGLAGERVGGRLSYSPNYLVKNARTVYAELNAGYPLTEKLAAIAHLGYLASLSGTPQYFEARRADARAGLGTGLAGWKLELAWDVSQSRQIGYSAAARSSAWVLSGSYPF